MKNRSQIGIRAGIIGILVNITLFIIKIVIGLSTGSNAIIADAFNNLSDSMNSLITMVGFIMAAKPADKEHPYGHGRIELIGGFLMSIIMLYIGFDVLQSSVTSLWNQDVVVYDTLAYVIMFISITLKLFLYFYYKLSNRKVNSDVLTAGAQDSLNDVMISIGILIGILIQSIFHINYMDGLIGILISAVILFSSLKLIKGFVDDLIGPRPDTELIEDIVTIINQYDVLGFHDLMIHNYGNERIYASVHIELPSSLTLIKAHDLVDCIERDVKKNYNIDLLIHLDPVNLDDDVVLKYQPIIEEILMQIHPNLKYHDMRYIHDQLMFDISIGDDVQYTDSEMRIRIETQLQKKGCDIHTQIQFDRNPLIL